VDELTPASDPKKAGEQLNAAHVLVGSVQRNGDHVRVIAQLVRTSDGTFIWSQSFDRRGSGVISIQSEIASAIARDLRIVTKASEFQGGAGEDADRGM
jgi:TolB-like protein